MTIKSEISYHWGLLVLLAMILVKTYYHIKEEEQGYLDAIRYASLNPNGGQGTYAPIDYERGFEAMQKLAKEGKTDAQMTLGRLYYHGGPNIKQDYKEAYIWVSLALEGTDKVISGFRRMLKDPSVVRDSDGSHIKSRLKDNIEVQSRLRQLQDAVQNKLTPEALAEAQAEALRRSKEIE